MTPGHLGDSTLPPVWLRMVRRIQRAAHVDGTEVGGWQVTSAQLPARALLAEVHKGWPRLSLPRSAVTAHCGALKAHWPSTSQAPRKALRMTMTMMAPWPRWTALFKGPSHHRHSSRAPGLAAQSRLLRRVLWDRAVGLRFRSPSDRAPPHRTAPHRPGANTHGLPVAWQLIASLIRWERASSSCCGQEALAWACLQLCSGTDRDMALRWRVLLELR
mmetsp:Transcript_1321/g.2871  ORF Transcript_1321/g.2871 Transcript_1321/m.2871 type:complete len:217 (-) Transcript_1321:2969-3619(-)